MAITINGNKIHRVVPGRDGGKPEKVSLDTPKDMTDHALVVKHAKKLAKKGAGVPPATTRAASTTGSK